MSLKSRGAKVDFMPSVESSSQPQFPAFMFSRSYKHRWKLGGDSPPPLSKLQRNLSDWRGFKAHYCPQKLVPGDQLEKKNCEIANGALVAEEWKGNGGLAHNGTRPKPHSCFSYIIWLLSFAINNRDRGFTFPEFLTILSFSKLDTLSARKWSCPPIFSFLKSWQEKIMQKPFFC